MSTASLKKLHIDSEFQNLVRPLSNKEYLHLEADILAHGCRVPVTTWNGTILNGYERYEICTEHQIPFEITEMQFVCREEAVAWICTEQLKRTTLAEEMWKYLVGKLFASEKAANEKRSAWKPHAPNTNPATEHVTTSRKIAERIAAENHIAHGTVYKYCSYAFAIDTIGQKVPDAVPKILSGKCKISQSNVLELANRSAEDIKKVILRIEKNELPVMHYNFQKPTYGTTVTTDSSDTPTVPSIKDMPKYDPDAEISSLTLTIPSWTSSINRICAASDLSNISPQARRKLLDALNELHHSLIEIISMIGEE